MERYIQDDCNFGERLRKPSSADIADVKIPLSNMNSVASSDSESSELEMEFDSILHTIKTQRQKNGRSTRPLNVSVPPAPSTSPVPSSPLSSLSLSLPSLPLEIYQPNHQSSDSHSHSPTHPFSDQIHNQKWWDQMQMSLEAAAAQEANIDDESFSSISSSVSSSDSSATSSTSSLPGLFPIPSNYNSIVPPNVRAPNSRVKRHSWIEVKDKLSKSLEQMIPPDQLSMANLSDRVSDDLNVNPSSQVAASDTNSNAISSSEIPISSSSDLDLDWWQSLKQSLNKTSESSPQKTDNSPVSNSSASSQRRSSITAIETKSSKPVETDKALVENTGKCREADTDLDHSNNNNDNDDDNDDDIGPNESSSSQMSWWTELTQSLVAESDSEPNSSAFSSDSASNSDNVSVDRSVPIAKSETSNDGLFKKPSGVFIKPSSRRISSKEGANVKSATVKDSFDKTNQDHRRYEKNNNNNNNSKSGSLTYGGTSSSTASIDNASSINTSTIAGSNVGVSVVVGGGGGNTSIGSTSNSIAMIAAHPSKRGVLRFDNGVYKGDIIVTPDGYSLAHGYGTFTSSNGELYIGQWKMGKRDGRGMKLWEDGREYIGQWKVNRRSGYGMISWTNRDIYIGEIQYGFQQGQGMLKCANGEQYTGEWNVNERHGYGVMRFLNGDSFTGQWQHNKKHGHGFYRFADGKYVEGEWEENKFQPKSIPRKEDSKDSSSPKGKERSPHLSPSPSSSIISIDDSIKSKLVKNTTHHKHHRRHRHHHHHHQESSKEELSSDSSYPNANIPSATNSTVISTPSRSLSSSSLYDSSSTTTLTPIASVGTTETELKESFDKHKAVNEVFLSEKKTMDTDYVKNNLKKVQEDDNEPEENSSRKENSGAKRSIARMAKHASFKGIFVGDSQLSSKDEVITSIHSPKMLSKHKKKDQLYHSIDSGLASNISAGKLQGSPVQQRTSTTSTPPEKSMSPRSNSFKSRLSWLNFKSSS